MTRQDTNPIPEDRDYYDTLRDLTPTDLGHENPKVAW